jgi:hypothetical protein
LEVSDLGPAEISLFVWFLDRGQPAREVAFGGVLVLALSITPIREETLFACCMFKQKIDICAVCA